MKENAALKHAIANARARLREAVQRLKERLRDKQMMMETPLEVQDAMEIAIETIGEALRSLEAAAPKKRPSARLSPDAPTRQLGQFLAFIREYIMRNEAGLAPTHAAPQQFFNLTAPSVNSMLIRLEQRGFIRRIRRKARAIELIIEEDQIPPLDRPFRF